MIMIMIMIMIMMMMMMMMMMVMKMMINIIHNPRSHERDSNTHRDWCTWNYLEESKCLVCEVESVLGSAKSSAILSTHNILPDKATAENT